MSEVTSTNVLVKDSTMQTLNSKLDTLNTTLGGNTNIAPVFNTATAYTKGDMVYYNNDLYVFTSNHSAGAWTGNDVVQTKVSTELASLKSGLIIDKSQSSTQVDVNGTFQIGENVLRHNVIIVGMHRYAYGGSVVLQKDVLEAASYGNGCGIYVNPSTYVTFTVSATGLITVVERNPEWGALNIIVYGIL